MPITLESFEIKTKVINFTCDAQSRLLDIYKNPENVRELYIRDLHVFCLWESEGEWLKFQLGDIKSKYAEYLKAEERYIIKQWRITGGVEIPGYNGLHTHFGLNITLNF